MIINVIIIIITTSRKWGQIALPLKKCLDMVMNIVFELPKNTVTVYGQFNNDRKNNLKWGLRKPYQVFAGSPPTCNIVDKYKSHEL